MVNPNNTRQDKMAQQIIELGGNILEVKSRYRLVLDYPLFINAQYTLTRDRISGKSFILANIRNGRKWYMMTPVGHLDMYLLRELKFIRYEEIFDIKFEWKHHKELERELKRIKKASKT